MKFLFAFIAHLVFFPLASAVGNSIIINEDCNGADSQDECTFPGCFWDSDRCNEIEYETCEFIANEEGCKTLPSMCIWVDGECVDKPTIGDGDCESADSEDECLDLLEECYWDDDRCSPIPYQPCGISVDAKSCNAVSKCVWLSDPDRPDGICTELEDLDGCSGSDGLVIQSRSKCISKKGCSWSRGDSGWGCSDAPSQLECDDTETKNACRQQGCVSKIRKKKRVCLGRWESIFLPTLKGMDGVEARKAIKAEFGQDTYIVRLVDPGDKPSKIKNSRRIRLFLDENGAVKKAPRFG